MARPSNPHHVFDLAAWAQAERAPLRDHQSGQPICWGPGHCGYGTCSECAPPAVEVAIVMESPPCARFTMQLANVEELQPPTRMDVRALTLPERYANAAALIEWLDTPHPGNRSSRRRLE